MSSKKVVKKKKKETRVNKKNTNEYHLDLRQDVAWRLYTDQRSDTFNNAYKSAVKAGFAVSTAKNITVESWWIRRVKLLAEMLPLAEKILMEDMTMETTTPMLVNKEIVDKIDPQLRRIRADTGKFIASTVGRDKYHTKTEVEASAIISLVEGNSLIDNLFGQ